MMGCEKADILRVEVERVGGSSHDGSDRGELEWSLNGCMKDGCLQFLAVVLTCTWHVSQSVRWRQMQKSSSCRKHRVDR
jgi:hypothetical protein